MNRDDYVDIFQIRFPRITKTEALRRMLNCVGSEMSTNISFVDMSALNQMFKHKHMKSIFQSRAMVLNNGSGMAFAAWQQKKPFPENLNATDLCIQFLEQLPKGSTIYILGSIPHLLRRARYTFAEQFPHVKVIGAHHGYLGDREEHEVIETIKKLKPQVVLVGMGNPQQVELIDRYLDDEDLKGTVWLGVGGFFHYFSGDLKRAPDWFKKNRLEWFYILLQQPHKFMRYIFGIPYFIAKCTWAHWNHKH